MMPDCGIPLEISHIQQLFREKYFSEIYRYVFEDLIARTSGSNERNIANLERQCIQLNFKEIEKDAFN